MGGPMGAGDDAEHPWLAAEKRLVARGGRGRAAVPRRLPGRPAARRRARRPRLRGRAPEVGLLDVELTAEGRDDPLFAGFDEPLVSLQWHGDTFDLPAGRGAPGDARRWSPNQAFRAGERAYGVQFHLEVTGEMAREWGEVPAYRESLAATLGERGGAAFIADVERRAGELHPPARRLFANWLDVASAGS